MGVGCESPAGVVIGFDCSSGEQISFHGFNRSEASVTLNFESMFVSSQHDQVFVGRVPNAVHDRTMGCVSEWLSADRTKAMTDELSRFFAANADDGDGSTAAMG
jgi:hypothetical protein